MRHRPYAVLLLLVCSVMACEKPTPAEAICRNADWPPGVTILYSPTTAFTQATARWNAYGAPSYCAAVSPSTEEEVASIVKAANAAAIPFLATGGRHNFGTTLRKLQHGLAIDLSLLNTVTVDKESSTAIVGGGANIQQVLDAVSEAGFVIPSGSCGCAGYIGASIGAGIGWLQGTLGLAIDALVSARLVTASGEVVEVSQSSNPDLFWAIRGAGANFGIITSAVFKVTNQMNNGQVYYADIIYSSNQAPAYFELMESLNGRFPEKLGFSTTMFWNGQANQSSLLTTLIWAGSENEALQSLSSFFDLKPVIVASKEVPVNMLPKLVLMGIIEASCQTTNGITSIPSLNVRQFSAQTYLSVFNKFDAFVKQYPDSQSSAFIFETFSNHAPLSVRDSETAYPWRDATGNIMLQLRWTGLDNPFQETANAFGREIRAELAATSGYSDLSVYVSYAYGDETLEQKYGRDKLQRLLKLKEHWDPKNRFRYCQPLNDSS
ncbi:FAD-binding domain-containing protein [Nemania sp. FL0916]|nr:FAD-binding domain-containing protein [Nemania sp. FL0916]